VLDTVVTSASWQRLWSLSRKAKRKGKGLVRRTILVSAAMLVMLLVAGGVAFAVVNCDPFLGRCECKPGVLCEGTSEAEDIYGSLSGDTIYAYDGDDGINGRDGDDYIEGGRGNDVIEGDSVYASGNDELVGGEGNDMFEGGEGYDVCDGGPGTDTADAGCERQVSIEETW
jgi:hypothetical protein